MRENQSSVLNEICEAFNSGYRYILLEAPTGFGKSPVAVAVAMTLGSSYICTSTKDLQTQYARDFPYFKLAKGKNNFGCLVKEDFLKNGTYKCGSCPFEDDKCSHTSVAYGPCMTEESFKGDGCKYKTSIKDYSTIYKGTKNEQVYIDSIVQTNYQKQFLQWSHINNLNNIEESKKWKPCPYFDQLNIALNASHSIFNYSNFLLFLPSKILHPRELLVLDEGHLLETEIVKFRGLSISKRRWRRYIHNLEIDDYGYNDIEKWINFLIELESKMLTLTEKHALIREYAKERKLKYGWQSQKLVKDKKNNSISKLHENPISDPVQYYDSEEEIAQYQQDLSDISNGKNNISDELLADAFWDTEKLTFTIDSILSNPRNWIVSDIKKEEKNEEVLKVELKPLDVSPYCKNAFDKCSKTLIMSATILNSREFCRSVGLNYDDVKFIQVPSDFPIENRLIYPLNIAYLNFRNLQLQETKFKIAKAIDNIMSLHKNNKGIIHTTSYEQLNFIKVNISQENTGRLLETDPDIQRDEVIAEHINSTTKPTVLISPSFNTGLDLKDDLSRFQIITKVPYPNLGDRWINAKSKLGKDWYDWQTALKLVQTYGRSVRSKEDWAKTYILDSAFTYFAKKNRNILPEWFKQAIKLKVQ